MRSKTIIIYYILLLIGIIVLVNILADRFYLRLDFTEDKQYTLSDATENILKNLNETVTITAYFSEDLPPQLMKIRKDFEDILVEYETLSDGDLVFQFINPNEDEEAEQKAVQSGIRPVNINVQDKDQMKIQRAYLGAVVEIGGQQTGEIIPVVQPGAAMEYSLSTAIKKVSSIDKPLLGLLQGHGEAGLAKLRNLNESLSIMYEVQDVSLNDTIDNLSKYKTLLIVAPTDSFPANHLSQLDDFLASGKNLMVALNRVKGDFQTGRGSSVNTGLESWLSKHGLTVHNNFVLDEQSASTQVPQQYGNFVRYVLVNIPYVPIISNFPVHPATEGIEAVMMQFASSIEFTGDSSKVSYAPLALTSDKSATNSSPTMLSFEEHSFPLSNLVVAASLSGKIQGDKDSKMVVFSDGDFILDENFNPRMNIDNMSFAVNTVDWLSDDTGLIALRTKGVTMRPIEQMESGKKTFLKYLNFLLPVILIVLYGIFRMQFNRNLRIKRMEENYV